MSSVIDPHAHRANRPSSARRNWRQNYANPALIQRHRQVQQNDAVEHPDATLHSFHQPLLNGIGGGLCAGRKAQLAQDIANMYLGGLG